MPGHVDDVVGAGHDVEIAILVDHARVTSLVVAREGCEVALAEPLLRVPQRRQRARRQWELDGHRAKFVGAEFGSVLAEDTHVVAGHWHGWRAELDRQRLDADGVADDGPASLGLPPVIVDVDAEGLARPDDGVGVGALARKVEAAQAGDVAPLEHLALGILALDRPKRRRRGEEGAHVVLGDHPPEHAGVRGADRLALEHHRGVAVDQRRVADVAVANDPANVRGGPEHVARIEVVDVLHAPVQGHQMPGRGAHHALGRAGRAGGVEDVGGVAALHRHALRGLGSLLEGVPFMVAALDQRRGLLLALQDHAEFRLVAGEIDGPVEQGLVGDDPSGLEAAGGGDHRLGAGVVDAHGKLVGGESPEHHRVDRPEPSTGEHCGERLGHHRHVEDHPVALLDAARAQRACEPGDALKEFGIGDLALRVGDRAVVDDGDLIAAPGLDMPVEGVPAGVDLAVAEPLVEGGVAVEEGLARLLDPVDGLGRLHPEPFRILLPALIDLPVPHGACPPHRSCRSLGAMRPIAAANFPNGPRAGKPPR